MQQSYPSQGSVKTNQGRKNPSYPNAADYTWGSLINNEHQRMEQNQPHSEIEQQSQMKPKNISYPTTWGEAVAAEKQKLNKK
jgi:hypothetical protein